MKKIIYSLTLLFALTAMHLDASAQTAKAARNDQFGLANHVGLGIDLISPDACLGLGVSAGLPLAHWVQIRAGYAIVPWSFSKIPFSNQPLAFDIPRPSGDGGDPIHADFNISMKRHTGHVFVDFLPFKNSSFHFTAGFLAGTSELISLSNITPLPESYDNLGLSYYPNGDDQGEKRITNEYKIRAYNGKMQIAIARKWAVRPYVGLGWGTIVPSKRVGVLFDMGVEYTGGIGIFTYADNYEHQKTRINLDGAGMKHLYEKTAEKAIDSSMAEAFDIVDKIYKIPIAGYLKLTLVIKLF